MSAEESVPKNQFERKFRRYVPLRDTQSCTFAVFAVDHHSGSLINVTVGLLIKVADDLIN
jgi:hypothetical protein